METAKGLRAVTTRLYVGVAVALAAACAEWPVQITQSRSGAYETALAIDRDGFVVAWYDTRDGNAEIYSRLLDRDGRPAGPERRLTETPDRSYEPSLARVEDDVVVAWYEQRDQKTDHTAMLGRWSRDGARVWERSIAPGSRNPVARSNGHAIFCAWIQSDAGGSESVWGGWWDADGHPRSSQRLAPVSATTWNLNAMLDGDRAAWVVFDAVASTRSSELFAARLDRTGAAVIRLTRDDGMASKYPDVAVSDDGVPALAWFDERDGNQEVYLYTGPLASASGAIDDRAVRVSTTPDESTGAYVAWNHDRIGLAWSDKIAGAHEIYFQPFDRRQVALAPARRLTRNETWSLVPAIVAWSDGFALAWNEYRPESKVVHGGTSELAFALVR
jgi:hypothetical protein